MRHSILAILLAAGILAGFSQTPADVPSGLEKKILLTGEHKGTAARLKQADRLAFLAEKPTPEKWEEAVEEYQRIIYEEGDNLVPLVGPGGQPSWRSIQARRLCHLRISAAPPSVRKRYQKSVDILAEKLFQEGTNDRLTPGRSEPLQRLVKDLFCSRFSDRALERLGDWAFERGDFAEALQWWRLLALLPSETGQGRWDTLLFPDPQVDVARVRAKQIITLAFRGDRGRAEAELKGFQALHGTARGTLAGREGLYAEILLEVLGRTKAGTDQEPWPTFAGSGSRNKVPPRAPSPQELPPTSTWRVALPENLTADPGPGSRRFPYHPVIADDRVLIAGAGSVTGYNLLTGRLLFRYDLKSAGLVPVLPKAPANSFFTLTAAGSRIFVRLGAPLVGPGKDDKSFLICLDAGTAPGEKRKADTVRQVWQVTPPAKAVFQGAPMVHEGRLYIALSQVVEQKTKTSLACYDVGTGALQWLQDVCQTPEFVDAASGSRSEARRRPCQHLVTLAGSLVVYCPHSGAIVAVDRLTGKSVWGVRYQSRGPELPDGTPSPRALAPCLFSNGRLFVAPLDAERIFCLDAFTGQKLWERDGIEVVHLLGEAQGRLIFTTARGLRALAAGSGTDQGGWQQPVVGTLPPMGRGLLAGNWVFWPTRDPKLPLRAVTQDQGEQESLAGDQAFEPTQLRNILAGNMALGNGCLVVAGSDELVCYVAPERFLPKLQAEAREPGAGAAVYYRLGQAEIGAGKYNQALVHLALAGKAPAQVRWKKQSVATLAQACRHELLLRLARSAEKDQALPAASRRENTAGFLQQATGPEFPVSLRLLAHDRLAELWLRAGQPPKAVAVLQGLLLDKSLRAGTLVKPASPPEAGDVFATRRIQELMKDHGPGIFADFEQQARERLDKAHGNIFLLEKLAREYPAAAVCQKALQELAALQEKAGRSGAAAQSYRTLCRRAKGADLVPLLAGLARTYEHQQCWEAARATWLNLAKNHGDQHWQGRRVTDLVTDKLARPAYQEKKNASLPVPLTRTWDTAGFLLPGIGNTRTAMEPAVAFLLTKAGRFQCRDAASGKLRWEQQLGFRPEWAGLHKDVVLACGKREIHALRLEDGQRVWQLTWPPAKSLSRFCLTKSRLWFFCEGSQLLALDPANGQVAWSRWAKGAALRPLGGGQFCPFFHASPEKILLQSSDGKRLVLDAGSGKLLGESSATASWSQDPRPLDDRHFCLVEGSKAVLLDAVSGKERWSYTPPWPTSLTGEPLQVTGNGKALLAVAPRNYGYEVERLDPVSGQSLWPADPSRLIGLDPFDRQALACDDSAFYFAGDNLLTARSLSDGKLLWKQPLTPKSSRWKILAISNHLLVFPSSVKQPPWLWLPIGGFLLAVPAVNLFENRPHSLGLAIHEPGNGRLLQQLDFSVPDSQLEVQVFPRGIVVAGGGRVWGYETGK